MRINILENNLKRELIYIGKQLKEDKPVFIPHLKTPSNKYYFLFQPIFLHFSS